MDFAALKLTRLALIGALSLGVATAAWAVGAWSASERLEKARANLSASAAGDLIYIGGGAGAGDPSDAFDVFDASNESWRALPALPKGLINFGMAAAGKIVVVAGGYTADDPGKAIKDAWAFNTDSATWLKVSSMPSARANHAMVALGGKVYVVGGSGAGADKTFVYNPDTDHWTTAPGLPTSRRALAAATDGRRIYAVGGIKSDGNVSGALEVFDPATGVWSAMAAMPKGRGALTAAVMKNQLHVAGGATVRPLKTFADHDIFDLGSKTWRKGPELPTARQSMASGFAGGRWYVMGGGAGAGVFGVFTASDAVESYEP